MKENKTKKYNIILSIFTLVIILAIISIYEIGICNYEWLYSKIKQIESIAYNFSMFRIICYLSAVILYSIIAKNINQKVIEGIKNNLRKKIVIITWYIIGIIFIGITLLLRVKIGNLTVILLILGVLNTYLFVTYLSKNYAKNLILTGLTFGIMFSISVDFNHAIDEKKHFMSAFNLAMGNSDFVNPITDNVINDIPHFSNYINFNKYYGITYEPNITDEVNMDDVPSTPATYLSVMYLPSAIGMKVAMVLKASIADIYIIGRIMNLFAFIGLAICALRILPYKKDVFQVVFMLPIVICMGATYSVDSIALGLAAIFIATCLKIYNENRILNIKDVFILAGALILLCLAKTMAYVAIAIIFLMLPIIKTLKANKKYLKYIVPLCIIGIIIIAFLCVYVKNNSLKADPRGGETSIDGQVQFIIENPIKAVKVGINQIMNTVLNVSWLQQMNNVVFFGEYSKQIFTINMIFILYVAITDSSHNFKIKNKVLFVLGSLLSLIMTSVILYLGFTPVGAENVEGYQTRYIIPFLPLLLMCISSKNMKYEESEDRKLVINCISGFIIFIALIGNIFYI